MKKPNGSRTIDAYTPYGGVEEKPEILKFAVGIPTVCPFPFPWTTIPDMIIGSFKASTISATVAILAQKALPYLVPFLC